MRALLWISDGVFVERAAIGGPSSFTRGEEDGAMVVRTRRDLADALAGYVWDRAEAAGLEIRYGTATTRLYDASTWQRRALQELEGMAA